VHPQIEGLSPTFYFCKFYDPVKIGEKNPRFRANYDKYLNALGRALPGWYFESQKASYGADTWEIIMAGPDQCTLSTCPIKLRLLDNPDPYSELFLEVAAPSDKTAAIVSDSYKKQFIEDVRALFAAAESDFRGPVEEQSFTKHGFQCLDLVSFVGTTQRVCDIQPLPFGRIVTLVEIAKEAIMEVKPTWRTTEENFGSGRGFYAWPAECPFYSHCGIHATWSINNSGAGSGFDIRLSYPAKKKR